ncbi:pancortin-3 [Vreelandella nigrificans]|uniref:Pancortin-3 n=1 Tax=Vreelandella nigrificans TaxID=2042704 RepID=A0A2A4HI70_9GAMM|nr:pancortin-3 [Halomonas nigrificans]PCF93875.1 pancortin-3 [Halomonas nigrificans]
MHDYAVFGHDRSAIGRWLGFISIALSGGIAQLLAIASNLSGIDAFTKATITTGIVYFFLHWIFNKWVWKVSFFEVPNINGTWELKGKTLNEDGTTKYDWEGSIGIEQTWKNIQIHLKTKKSQSESYTATLSRRFGPTGGWLLSYSYKNEPEIEQSHELNSHKGYCEVEFNKELTVGKASYFNSAGRKTFGVMNLRRVK